MALNLEIPARVASKRRGRLGIFFIGTCILICVFVGYRDYHGFECRVQLIQAVQTKDVRTAAVLLDQGTDPNIISSEAEARKLPFYEQFRRYFAGTVLHKEYIPDSYKYEYDERGNHIDFRKRSLLLQATSRMNPEMVQLLLDHGAKLDPAAAFSYLTLSSPKVLKMFLARGFDVNTRYESSTLLHSVENTECMEILLARGAQVNALQERGVTPLMAAASGKSDEQVKLLLAHGADPWMKDERGAYPLHFARSTGTRNIVRLLERAMHVDDTYPGLGSDP